jgi:uncharacterized GH25 family protein
MKTQMLLTLFLSSSLLQAEGQEFWMQPERFLIAAGEKLAVSFKKGENFMDEPWLITKAQIENLTMHHSAKSNNLMDSIADGEKNNLMHLIKATGTYVLTLQSHNMLAELPADQFNEYLKSYGLDESLDQRTRSNTLSSPARDHYAVQSKLMFQVGDNRDDTYKKEIGFQAEIIPDRNPYALKVGDQIRFKILFDGKPVFGVRAKVWNRFDNRTTIQNIYTEKDGTFEARISNPGPWMVTVVRMMPSKETRSDWQSYRSSLIFGIEK